MRVFIKSLTVVGSALFLGCAQPKKFSGTNSNVAPSPPPSPPGEPKAPPVDNNTFIVDEPNKKVVFGDNKVFHIGDGQFEGTSCKDEIDKSPLKGTTYFFEFDVLEAQTKIDVVIQKVCGVDMGHTNFVSLQSDNKIFLEPKAIATPSSQIPLKGILLNPGRYSVVVKSTKNADSGRFVVGDSDNFLVGKLEVKYDKKINPIGVRTDKTPPATPAI